MVLDSTSKVWFRRYFKPKFTRLIENVCELCGEQLTTDFFQDILGLKFCDRACFNKTRAFRHSKVFLIQKAYDFKYFKSRPHLAKRGK